MYFEIVEWLFYFFRGKLLIRNKQLLYVPLVRENRNQYACMRDFSGEPQFQLPRSIAAVIRSECMLRR